jgi:hypothetical protein
MRFAVLAQNETLDGLAARVYDVPAGAPAGLRDAGKALAEANPFLRRIDQVPAGTVVVVPPVAGVEPTPQAYAPDALPAEALVNQLRGAVELVRQSLSSEIDAELAESKSVAGVARSRDAKAAARENPELGDELPRVAEAATARAEAARALQRYQVDAFARMEFDLEDLLAAFQGSPPDGSAR